MCEISVENSTLRIHRCQSFQNRDDDLCTELPNSAFIYRAIKRKWIDDNGVISAEAYLKSQISINTDSFELRWQDDKGKWEEYVSCSTAYCTASEYARSCIFLERHFNNPEKRGAVVRLVAGHIKNLNLRACQVHNRDYHAGIFDLPDKGFNDPEKAKAAEDMADKLINISIWAWPLTTD